MEGFGYNQSAKARGMKRARLAGGLRSLMAKVLIVDDQPDVLHLLEMLLEREHDVRTATNGADALRRAEDFDPDLILLDVMMPVLDGYRVLHRLKSNPETRDITVIMVTARADAHDVAVGLDLGADYYVTKPFEPQDILALVRSASRAAEGGADARKAA